MAPAIPALIFTVLYEGRNPLAKALPNSFRTYTPELVAAMSNAVTSQLLSNMFVAHDFTVEKLNR